MEKIFKAILTAFCELRDTMQQLVSANHRRVDANILTIEFSADIQNTIVLPKNENRIGFTVSNRSGDVMFLAFDQNNCSPQFHTYAIDSLGGVDYVPNRNPYRDIVRIYVNDITGFATITEYSYAD